ncbi:hypothetical protein Tco_0748591, partial [Tanacetum coccineum]
MEKPKNALWEFWIKDAQDEDSICTIMKGHRPEARDYNIDKSDNMSVHNNAPHCFNEDDELLNEG